MKASASRACSSPTVSIAMAFRRLSLPYCDLFRRSGIGSAVSRILFLMEAASSEHPGIPFEEVLADFGLTVNDLPNSKEPK